MIQIKLLLKIGYTIKYLERYFGTKMTKSNFGPRLTNDRSFPFTGSGEQQLEFLLRYATLAPSHYNSQPWKFRLNAGGVEIIEDVARCANIVDPRFRELTISCGAAISMIEVAARYFGYVTSVSFPEKNQSEVLARVELINKHGPSNQDKLLFQAIKQRQTNRGWFTNAVIPDNVVKSCHTAAKELDVDVVFTSETRLKEEFASLTAMAVRQQISMPWYRLEFSSWLRSTFSFKPDGLTGFGFFKSDLPLPITKTAMLWFNHGKKIGDFNKNKVVCGSPILAVISTHADTKESWINTGRLLSRLLLELTSVGLSASFLNQAIQESNLRNQVRGLFGCEANPQLILRIGTAQKVRWTPRIAVDDCLV